MVDRIEKTLRKLSSKERHELLFLVERILRQDIAALDIKKLQGYPDTYRIRKGRFRIIFHMVRNTDIQIISIERRSDTTYADL